MNYLKIFMTLDIINLINHCLVFLLYEKNGPIFCSKVRPFVSYSSYSLISVYPTNIRIGYKTLIKSDYSTSFLTVFIYVSYSL